MASCCCGLNTILNLPVPSGDKGDGPAVNVSGMQGRKTIEISGAYAGAFWVYGSHDGNLFFPVANFNSGGGSQTVRRTLDVAANFMKVHREAPQSGLVTVNVAARATVPCATSGQSGANNFFNLATLAPGTTGPQAALDLFTLAATTGLDASSVACAGAFTGQISIEGSLDGRNFSPVGSFSSSQSQRGSQPGQLVFDPVVVGQIIRYLRVNVLPGTVVAGPTFVTIGGPQNCDCAAEATCLRLHPDIAGVVGLWQFQNTLADASGFGSDLTPEVYFEGPTPVSYVALDTCGTVGLVLPIKEDCANPGGFITVGAETVNNPQLRLLGDATVEFLILPGTYQGNFVHIVSEYPGPPFSRAVLDWGYEIPPLGAFHGHYHFSGDAFQGGSFTPNILSKGIITQANHFALRVQANVVQIFINGVLQPGSRPHVVPTAPGNTYMEIGLDGICGAGLDSPIMATLRILNYARSDAEIAADAAFTLGL